jgi:hypothetical protein
VSRNRTAARELVVRELARAVLPPGAMPISGDESVGHLLANSIDHRAAVLACPV